MSKDIDLDYLRDCISRATFVPFPWIGEDKNLAAFRSREQLIEWYCQPPATDGTPYRDRGFYTRELAMLSRIIQPRNVVEFGTSLGIGTCLLRWLNPNATITTVDIVSETFLPGDVRVPIGHLAKHEDIDCNYVQGKSWEYAMRWVDLCFIDADHSYESVVLDSQRAWDNRPIDHCWAIAWHDHNNRHPGVMKAVSEFCQAKCVQLQSRLDSDTVWITNIRK